MTGMAARQARQAAAVPALACETGTPGEAAPAAATTPRALVLHLTADYPDCNRPHTTLAVRNFIAANPAADHIVVSLNRTALPWRVNCIVQPDGVIAMRYFGLPLGVLLAPAMALVARRVLRALAGHPLPDLIHAHKLTFEGLAAARRARALGVPFVVSVRGEVASKVFAYKPHYRWLYGRVLRRAARIYYVSRWFRPVIAARYPETARKARDLPNFVALGAIRPAARFAPDRFVAVCNLEIWRRKGIGPLLAAFARARAARPGLVLDIIGGGGPGALAAVRRRIARHGLGDAVRLLGAMPHEALLGCLPGYAAMVLPSRNETFGMVYIEALLCGVPVLYSRGTGIDGYLDDVPAAIAADPKDIASIAAALCTLAERQFALRAWLIEHHGMLVARHAAGPYIAAYNAELAAGRAALGR